MGCDKNKIANSCLEKQFAVCVKYETELPEWSNIDDCYVSLEQTTEELYNGISDIKEELDSSKLKSNCLDVEDKKQNEINQILVDAVCDIKETLLDRGGDFNLCDLDYGDLLEEGPCDINKPTTICEFAQFVLNTLKELKNEQ